MNAITPIPVVEETKTWSAAHQAVNIWRGQAIHAFSQAEAEVSKTLLALSKDSKRGAKVGLRHMLGQRLEDLAVAIGPAGPFATEGKKASAVLAQFREHEPLRAALCHGAAKVALDQRGEWVLVLRMLVFRGREPEHGVMVFEQRDAADLLNMLRQCEQRLGAALRLLRERLSAKPATSAPPG